MDILGLLLKDHFLSVNIIKFIIGGFTVQGKTLEKAEKIYKDSIALQEAGCFAIVLEAIPEEVATFITSQLLIPTIGIGAGPGTSGQVLVQIDALKSHFSSVPKFCEQFSDIGKLSVDGLSNTFSNSTNL